MKILSDNAVTKDDLKSIDQKQNKQIFQLKIAVGASFLFNLLLTIALHYK